MWRGCFLSLLLYGALVAGYHYWFSQQFDAPGTWIAAGVVGMLTFFCIGALLNARTASRDLSLISAAVHGLPPADGRVVAACGTIEPLGEPVEAPLSGRKCVLCEYDIASQRRDPSQKNAKQSSAKDFTGFLMNPCVIRGAAGDIRLLGFPDLAAFSETRLHDVLSAARAREFLATTEFEDKSGLKFLGVLSALAEVWCDDDGLVSKHLRISQTAPASLFPADLDERLAQFGESPPAEGEHANEEDADDNADDEDSGDDLDDLDDANVPATSALPVMTEKRVNVGIQVCAIGVYQSAGRGLAPPRGSGKLNRLLPGDAETICRTLRGTVSKSIVGGLLALAIIHAAAWGFIQLNRHSPQEVRNRQRHAFAAAQQGDIAQLDKQLTRGLDVNARDSSGRTLLLETREPSVAAYLAQHGADLDAVGEGGASALMQAAREGRLELVAQLIASGANVNLRNSQDNATALFEAERSNHPEVAELLRKAGAREDAAAVH
jgi:hypothetical protein